MAYDQEDIHWICWRENLQETMGFSPSNIGINVVKTMS